MPTTKLSEHFALSEFLVSQTAQRLGIDNTPSEAIVANLTKTAQMLEKVRTLLGDKMMTITSGYRCLKLNTAIGSAPSSAHVQGQAADFICPDFGSVKECVIKIAHDRGIEFDQLIREFDDGGHGWVHIAWRENPRRQVLIIDSAGTRYWDELMNL